MKKGLLIGGGVFIAAIVIVVGLVFAGLDSIIKGAIESYGPDMTQSDVSVDEVDLSTSGEGSIKGMSVDNPEGFESEKAFSLSSIDVAIDTDTLTDDVVTIKKIIINQPEITYEIQKGGRTNLNAIMDNVNAYIEQLTGPSSGEGGASDDQESAEGEGQKFIVEHLRVEGGKVAVVASGLGLGEVSANLPTIDMKDIGKKKGGASAGEIVEALMAKIDSGALGAVQGLNIGDLNGLLQQGLDSLNIQGEKGTLIEGAEDMFEGFKSRFGK